jgi:hypothetical protein
MGSADFLSGWDTTILMVPFVGILVMHMFRLDERFSTPKASSGSRRFFCEVDPKGRPNASDPDGQPWHRQGVSEVEARLENADSSKGRASMRPAGSEDFTLARKTGSIFHI